VVAGSNPVSPTKRTSLELVFLVFDDRADVSTDSNFVTDFHRRRLVVGVDDVLRRASHAVGADYNAALEHEVVAVRGAAQSVSEGVERVSDHVLLRVAPVQDCTAATRTSF
jgi:hypothetical protein